MKTPNTRKAISLALLISMFVSTPIHCFSGNDITSIPKRGCAVLYNAFLRIIGKAPKKELTKTEKVKKFAKKNGSKLVAGGKTVLSGCVNGGTKVLNGCVNGGKTVLNGCANNLPRSKRGIIATTLVGAAVLGTLYWFVLRRKDSDDSGKGSKKVKKEGKEEEEEEEEEEEADKKSCLAKIKSFLTPKRSWFSFRRENTKLDTIKSDKNKKDDSLEDNLKKTDDLDLESDLDTTISDLDTTDDE